MFSRMAGAYGMTGQVLAQYGYSMFDTAQGLAIASAGDDYVLGPGDTLVLYLWGDPVDIKEISASYTLTVDRNGAIFFPPTGQFSVWGQDLATVRATLAEQLGRRYKKIDLNLTLASLRQFPVFVSGYAEKPGTVMASGADTIMSVLARAGGVMKSGSLRKIAMSRNDKGKRVTIEIDFYDALIGGAQVDLRIREGDSIHIPAIGPTVALAGEVKRPGIYELRGESSIGSAIVLAGEALPSAAASAVSVLRASESGYQVRMGTLVDKGFVGGALRDGELVLIGRASELLVGHVALTGPAKYPGRYEASAYKSLKALLNQAQILPETSLYYGRVYRMDASGVDRSFTFAPREVLAGTDIALKELDRVELVRFDAAPAVSAADLERFPETLIVEGSVRYPGLYRFAKGMTLAGIMKDNAYTQDTNLAYAELTRSLSDGRKEYLTFRPEDLASGSWDIPLAPRDRITFRPAPYLPERPDFDRFAQSVLLQGPARYPGLHAFGSGLKLSALMQAALPLLETNQYYAEIVRPMSGGRNQYLTFAPREVVAGLFDLDLQARDTVRLFSTAPAAQAKLGAETTQTVTTAVPATGQAPATTTAAQAPATSDTMAPSMSPAMQGNQIAQTAQANTTTVPGPAIAPVAVAANQAAAPSSGIATGFMTTGAPGHDLSNFLEVVTVIGNARYTGPYARTPTLRLSTVLTPDQILNETNLDYAELTRRDQDGKYEYLTFAPRDVLIGKYDLALAAQDSIRLVETGYAPERPDFDRFAQAVALFGPARNKGLYAFGKGLNLSALVAWAIPDLDANLYYAEIVRPVGSGRSQYLTFAPREVIAGQFDLALQARDTVRLFATVPVQAAKKAQGPDTATAQAVSPEGAAGTGTTQVTGQEALLANSAQGTASTMMAPAVPGMPAPLAPQNQVQAGQAQNQARPAGQNAAGPVAAPMAAAPAVPAAGVAVPGPITAGTGYDTANITEVVTVSGTARYTGPYARSPRLRLSTVLTPDQILQETNLEYAELTRKNDDGSWSYYTFAPRDVLAGTFDMGLVAQDAIRFVDTGYIPETPDFDRFPRAVLLRGPVLFPGLVAWRDGMKLSRLLPPGSLKAEANFRYAELERTDDFGRTSYLTFDPTLLIDGKFDLALKPRDIVRFVAKDRVGAASSADEVRNSLVASLESARRKEQLAAASRQTIAAEQARTKVVEAQSAAVNAMAEADTTPAATGESAAKGQVPAQLPAAMAATPPATGVATQGAAAVPQATPVASQAGLAATTENAQAIGAAASLAASGAIKASATGGVTHDFDRYPDAVIVAGAVLDPDRVAWRPGLKLGSLLTKERILVTTNRFYGEIERRRENARVTYVSFSPTRVAQGLDDLALEPRDIVRLFPSDFVPETSDFDRFPDALFITGPVKYVGLVHVAEAISLSRVVTPDLLLSVTDPYYAELDRRRMGGRMESMTFSPAAVIEGKFDLEIRGRDELRFLPIGSGAEGHDFGKYPDTVVVQGMVRYPGRYAWRDGMTLADIVRESDLLMDASGEYGEVRRHNGRNEAIFSFRPSDSLSREPDLSLRPRDVVKFYPKYNTPPVTVSGNVEEAKILPWYTGMDLLQVLRTVIISGDDALQYKAVITAPDGTSRKAYLQDVLKLKNAEQVLLKPGDAVSIQELLPDENLPLVTIKGAVRNPQALPWGTGMRLSDALKLSGGYAVGAFPEGLVLVRKSASDAQKRQIERLISQLESSTAAGLSLNAAAATTAEGSVTITNIQLDQASQRARLGDLKQIMKEGYGRITLDMPATLEGLKGSGADIVLERDDAIWVPETPSFVVVSGEVADQTLVSYRPDMTVGDAISQAGWTSLDADTGRSYILRASGRLVSANASTGSGSGGAKGAKILSERLLPGDTVVVPRLVTRPSLGWATAKDLVTIVASLITAVVSILVLFR